MGVYKRLTHHASWSIVVVSRDFGNRACVLTEYCIKAFEISDGQIY